MLGPREYADASERVHMIARPHGYGHVLMRLPGPVYGLSPEPITHTHPTLSRLVYLHVPAECACLPYLPALRRFLHHRTLHPTLQSAQDPPTAAVPILCSHCRSCPLKLLHFRPAITYRHSASPLGTTHVVLERQIHAVPSTYELLDYSP
jgi:hypothetical protein